jgi:hypothetical protein
MQRPVCRQLLVLGRKLVSAYHDPIASEANKERARDAINEEIREHRRSCKICSSTSLDAPPKLSLIQERRRDP